MIPVRSWLRPGIARQQDHSRGRQAMKFGISFPQAEIGTDRIVIRDFAQAAEAMGYSHISVPDHVIQAPTARGPVAMSVHYTRDFPHHEPMTMMGFIAGVTETIGINPAVVIMPQRQTVLVAKQCAELDVLCGGRLRMGVGIGWNELEFEALGMNFKDRARRMEEQVEVLRELWTKEVVTYRGKWHTITEAGLAPMPLQRPIPIWFGAVSDVAVKRAARLGDGWFMIARLRPDEESARVMRVFQDAAREAGRDLSGIGIESMVYAKLGGPDEWMREARGWVELGATQLVFRTTEAGYPSFDKHIDAMRQFAEAMKSF
jgi:probable F420-dependent oxidoreductase